MLPRIADVGEWFAVLRDAVLARPPSLLFAGEGGVPADDRLNGYLLKAGLLAAAASFVFEQFRAQMRAVIAADPHMAELSRILDEAHAAAARVPVAAAVVILDIVIGLGLICAALALLLRVAGRKIDWRLVLAGGLGVFVCRQVWRLASNWLSLKATPWMGDQSLGAQMLLFCVLIVWLANLAMPALALGRAARQLAPDLRRALPIGIAAYVGVWIAGFAISLLGVETALLRFFALPAGQGGG